VLSVVLLVLNILFKTDSISESSKEILVDKSEIEHRFKNIIIDFGISEDLIKESTIKDKSSGEKIPTYKVQVPKDLSIPELLHSIFQTFNKDSLQINSVEMKKGGKSVVELKINKELILKAELDYSKKIFRDAGSIAFILKNTNPEDPSTEKLIESSTKLNLLLRPELSHLQHLNFIRSNGKQYSILIDDEITEQKYKLSSRFSENRIVTVLKTLVTDFFSAAFFVIDDHSEFYNSPNRKVFTDELSKRGIKVFNLSDFILLGKEDEPVNTFKDKIESLKKDDGTIFLTDEETLNSLDSALVQCKRKGYKIINSSLLVDRIQ
jgi:hypothetical protein